MRQLTRDTKRDISCVQTMLTRPNENLRMTFGVSCHITFKEIIDKTLMKTISASETDDRFYFSHQGEQAVGHKDVLCTKTCPGTE